MLVDHEKVEPERAKEPPPVMMTESHTSWSQLQPETLSVRCHKQTLTDDVPVPLPSRKTQTLGTRTHIPSGHMLNTLGAQTMSVFNLPTGLSLITFRMYPAMGPTCAPQLHRDQILNVINLYLFLRESAPLSSARSLMADYQKRKYRGNFFAINSLAR